MSTALFIIDSDPRNGGRVAEAIRIAAGITAWRKVKVTLYMRSTAVLILGENADALVNGENYAQYLPILNGQKIYAQQGSQFLPNPSQSALPFEEISDDQLASVAATSDCVLRF